MRHHGAPALPAEPLSVTEALMHILGHLIDVILANAPMAARPNGAGPEAVHQMRVAVRRARSALSIFRGAAPATELDAVGGHFKELGSRLGPTRDWDVFAEETIPAIQRTLPNDHRLERLIAAASRRRRECQKVLAAYLGSSAFRVLGIELAWFAAAGFSHLAPPADPGEEADPPLLGDFAGSVLQHRWKKLLSSGKRIEELDVPSLHAVRLRAKRARYAAEMFSTLYPGKASHRFIRRLSALQQRLGVLNDGAVAAHLLEELGGPAGRHAYATGILVGFLAARAAKIRPQIVRTFERFRRQPAYWA
jgi:CHAD domain-containing protein